MIFSSICTCFSNYDSTWFGAEYLIQPEGIRVTFLGNVRGQFFIPTTYMALVTESQYLTANFKVNGNTISCHHSLNANVIQDTNTSGSH